MCVCICTATAPPAELAEDMVTPLMPVAFTYMRNEYDDVAEQVFPLIGLYINWVRLDTPAHPPCAARSRAMAT